MKYKKIKEHAAVFNAITMTGVIGVLAKVFFENYRSHLTHSYFGITCFEEQLCDYGPYVIALFSTILFSMLFKPTKYD